MNPLLSVFAGLSHITVPCIIISAPELWLHDPRLAPRLQSTTVCTECVCMCFWLNEEAVYERDNQLTLVQIVDWLGQSPTRQHNKQTRYPAVPAVAYSYRHTQTLQKLKRNEVMRTFEALACLYCDFLLQIASIPIYLRLLPVLNFSFHYSPCCLACFPLTSPVISAVSLPALSFPGS